MAKKKRSPWLMGQDEHLTDPSQLNIFGLRKMKMMMPLIQAEIENRRAQGLDEAIGHKASEQDFIPDTFPGEDPRNLSGSDFSLGGGGAAMAPDAQKAVQGGLLGMGRDASRMRDVIPGKGLLGGQLSEKEFYAKLAKLPGFEAPGLAGLMAKAQPGKPRPGFTLSPGQSRYDAEGNLIADLPDLNKAKDNQTALQKNAKFLAKVMKIDQAKAATMLLQSKTKTPQEMYLSLINTNSRATFGDPEQAAENANAAMSVIYGPNWSDLMPGGDPFAQRLREIGNKPAPYNPLGGKPVIRYENGKFSDEN